MSVKSKVLPALAAIGLLGGIATAVIPATAARAETQLGTPATTAITDDGASSVSPAGDYGVWADNTSTRTTTLFSAPASTCTSQPALAGFTAGADVCYAATITDTGTFQTVLNARQPNQGSVTPADATGNTITHVISGTFSGTSGYVFYAPAGTSVGTQYVTPSFNGAGVADYLLPVAQDETQNWFEQLAASPGAVTGVQLSGWSWAYAACTDTWTDSFADGYGQSTPLSTDGNITGDETCTTPAPAPSPSTSTPAPAPAVLYGDEVNPFGNGLDVFRQRAAVNTVIAGWPATQHDPATHFLREPEGASFRFEYAPSGGGTGLCVSDPAGGYVADPGGPDGLVLRGCNTSKFQQFSVVGGELVSAVNGLIVSPDGTGAQLRATAAAVPWGGSKYTWTVFTALPA